MDAVEFLKAKTRMCRKHRNVGLYCKNARCPLAKVPTSPFGYATCAAAIAYYPEKAVAIVEKWAKENPPQASAGSETLLEVFNRQHPGAPKGANRLPTVCPYQLGYEDKYEAPCSNPSGKYDCLSCWKRLYKRSDKYESD